MTREAVADRLSNYADAAAAFSAVNSLAFLVTLAQPEVRCTLVNVKWLVVSGQLLQSLAIAFAVVMLRRGEVEMRAPSSPLAPDVERFLRGFFVGRLGVVGIFALFTIGGLAFALSDPVCTSRDQDLARHVEDVRADRGDPARARHPVGADRGAREVGRDQLTKTRG